MAPRKLLALAAWAATLAGCAPMPTSSPPPQAAAAPASTSGPKTREQVRAEVLAAQRDGTIYDNNGDKTIARELPPSMSM